MTDPSRKEGTVRTRLHLVFVLAAAATLAACQYLSPQRSGDGGSGEQGSLANERPSAGSGATAPGREATAPHSGSAERPAPERPAPPERPAAPEPTPTPPPRVIVVPEGTALSVTLETALSSGSNRTGDLVVARLAEAVRLDERVVLPEGSEVRGRVTAAVGSGRVKGRARLAVAFDSIEVGDRRHDIEATPIDITAGTTRKRDAAMIGGGALVGAVVDGKKGAGIGALLGGGAVLATKGKEVKLPAGTPVTLTLRRDLRI
jgi:hypothetical protein